VRKYEGNEDCHDCILTDTEVACETKVSQARSGEIYGRIQ